MKTFKIIKRLYNRNLIGLAGLALWLVWVFVIRKYNLSNSFIATSLIIVFIWAAVLIRQLSYKISITKDGLLEESGWLTLRRKIKIAEINSLIEKKYFVISSSLFYQGGHDNFYLPYLVFNKTKGKFPSYPMDENLQREILSFKPELTATLTQK